MHVQRREARPKSESRRGVDNADEKAAGDGERDDRKICNNARKEAVEVDGDDADEEAAGDGERNDGRIIASIVALGGI